MFYGRQSFHRVSKLDGYEDDGLGFKKPIYKEIGRIRMHLVEQDRSAYANNGISVTDAVTVAYTDSRKIHEGYLIDSKYKVTKTFPHRLGSVVYLEAYEDGK